MQRTNKFYRQNEREVMEQLGFRPTKNSGSGWIEKEDGINDTCICQLKSTDAKSISIKQSDLHTLEYNALVSHKIPMFAIQFLNSGEVWLMVRPSDIDDLLSGKQIEKSEQIVDVSVDIERGKCYTVREDTERTLARKKFYRDREKEREKNKEKRRESEREWKRSLRKRE